MRVADVVAGTLSNFGARHAFGMPGGEVVTLIDALNRAGIGFTLARQETGAAIMAAGQATLTGSVGVLVTTLGPGLANAVNGIADASQERVPLIVFAGVVDHGLRGRYTHQVIDQRALLRPVVKGCFEIEADGTAAVVARALRLALAHPQGPVLLELAPQTAAAPAGALAHLAFPVRQIGPCKPSPAEVLDEVEELLSAAERPLLIAGYEAARSGSAQALMRFAECWTVPVITTYKAKGVIPETHHLALGAAGLSPIADRVLLPIARTADLVIAAGYDPIEMRSGWLDPFQAGATVIEIGPGSYDHAMHHTSARIEGDIGTILGDLAGRGRAGGKSWACGAPAQARAELDALFASPEEWGPHSAIDGLQAALPDGAVVTVDSGAHRILLSQKLKISRPLGFLQSAGFCTMGAAVPLAAGAKIANPEACVVAVVGDGGFEMGIGELATLRDENLPVTIVVFQDLSLALIEMKQRQALLPTLGVRLGATRFEDVAKAFGGSGIRVASTAELAYALQGALVSNTFSVIVCEIKASDYDGRI